MRKLPVLFAFGVTILLCVATPGAQEAQRWPVKADLVARDWTVTDVQPWIKLGDVSIWHTKDDLAIEIIPGNDSNGNPFKIKQVSLATSQTGDFSALLDSKGKPVPSLFPYKVDYLGDQGAPVERATNLIDLHSFQLCFGTAEKCPLNRYLIIHAELMMADQSGAYVAVPEPAFAGVAAVNSTATVTFVSAFLDKKNQPIGWYLTYPFGKVQTGHFVDANVRGLRFWTPTQSGTTGDTGNFFYLPPERVYFWVGPVAVGNAVGDHTITPVDLFEGSDAEDSRVLNLARLLQSMDSHDAPGVIDVTENIPCLESAVSSLGLASIDFANDDQVTTVLASMLGACPNLTVVSKEDAALNLNQGQQAGNILKTNVSKNPEGASDKAKIEIMPFYVPARKADDSSTQVIYYDETGNVIETRSVAKPIVVTYEEEIEGTGARDIMVAVSRDDGSTWKRTNISKTAGKSSFTTEAGTACAGESNKPMLNVKDNKIFVAWTDKYCQGGRPRYSIKNASDYDCSLTGNLLIKDGILRKTRDGAEVCTPDYTGDDAYRQEDLYGVGGNQRSVTYADEWASMGEVAYSCVWTARGMIDAGGNIIWLKPERITSGRRDAMQLTSAAADEYGVAIAWQEDPKGLRPPSEYGPGDGWSGATVSNKTDIWYSFLKWQDFDLVDVAYVPPDNDDHVDTDPDLAGRAKALVPFSMPVKITDNDMCSLENILGVAGTGEDAPDVEEQLGTHRYCGTVQGIGTASSPGTNPLCAYTVPITNHDGVTHNVCVTGDAYPRVLDANTGASRPNLFLQPYQKPDGTKTAAAILAYEESKGLGLPPENDGDHDEVEALSEDEDDRYKPDLGKNVIYHSFPFDAPQAVNGGFIINAPEGGYVVDELGSLILDPLGRPQLAYGNARRVRLLAQPKGKVGASKTLLVALYREGAEGHGKAADIFMRRMTVTKELADGNPYSSDHFAGTVQNVSSVTPRDVITYNDVLDEETGGLTSVTKMVSWTWSDANLLDRSEKEPYSNALAHRGALTGDELIIAYSWVPNWGRQAPEKYDLYVRRSWDGGQTFRNGNSPVTHTITYVDPVTKELTETITEIAPGAPEPPRNVSNIRNNRVSVLEPRLVKTPGTITSPFNFAEDVQNAGIYQVAWGLEVNELLNADGQPKGTPLDIFYGQTSDKGQNYESVIVTRSDGTGGPQEEWNLLAKDKPEQSGAQIKQTPDGSRMYAIWVEKGETGSDIMFRRIDYRRK